MDDTKTNVDPRQDRKRTEKETSNEQVNLDKAQGSSRNDEADLRDVARKAAKKSQQRNL
jgi:hypothetical protein